MCIRDRLCIIDILQVALILRMGETGLNNLNTARLAVAKMKTGSPYSFSIFYIL